LGNKKGSSNEEPFCLEVGSESKTNRNKLIFIINKLGNL